MLVCADKILGGRSPCPGADWLRLREGTGGEIVMTRHYVKRAYRFYGIGTMQPEMSRTRFHGKSSRSRFSLSVGTIIGAAVGSNPVQRLVVGLFFYSGRRIFLRKRWARVVDEADCVIFPDVAASQSEKTKGLLIRTAIAVVAGVYLRLQILALDAPSTQS